MEEITIKHVRSYGNDRYYPVCILSQMMCELLQRKSLTKEQLAILEKYKFKIQFLGKNKVDLLAIYQDL